MVVTILVADDSDMVRAALCSFLKSRSGWTVCGEAANGNETVEKAIALKPDVILLDASMPDISGFEAARRIHEQVPHAEILIVTEQDARYLSHIGPQPSVRGYVLKSRLSRDLLPAVEAASKHQPFAAAMAAR